MNLLLQLFVLFLAFIYPKHEAMAQNLPPYTSIVAPITKHNDTATPLYSIPITSSNISPKFFTVNYLIDIDAPIVWNYCSVPWTDHGFYGNPRNVDPDECTVMQTTYSYESSSCPRVPYGSSAPGLGYYDCVVNVVNPVDGSCSPAGLNEDGFFMMNISDGRNPFPDFSDDGLVYPACVSSSMFKSFPENVNGVMALSNSSNAFYPSFFQPRQSSLALCLPSSLSFPGVLFIGTGPYYLLPNLNVDIRSLLSYTPLLKHPNSFGYFIGVKAILVKGISIDVSSRNNTTKLSTIERYTTLRTDIYNQLVNMFAIATKRIPRATPVAPFGLCLKNRNIQHTLHNLHLPDIVLSLQEGKKWNIPITNSMKQITEDVACLAFVDGGATREHAIVIGTFQLEDNFFLFDRENSTLGFSSSLLKKGTSCSNFNFTTSSV